MLNSMQNVWRLSVIALMAVLVGCGFHLRGSGNLGSIKGPIFVETDAYSEVAEELRRTLEKQ